MVWLIAYLAPALWMWGFVEGITAASGPGGLSWFEDRVLALGLAAVWPTSLMVVVWERFR